MVTVVCPCFLVTISTHALREEGDKMTLKFDVPAFNFYPRPPRGGRQNDPQIRRPGL